jgi:hypothetical protein
MVAELFGFTSGDELVRKILAAEPEATVIEGMTDQRMLERYGDLSSPEAIEQAANEAIHNEARAKFIATELRALAKATGQRNISSRRPRRNSPPPSSPQEAARHPPGQYAAAEARGAQRRAREEPGREGHREAQPAREPLRSARRLRRDRRDREGRAYLRRVGESKTIDPTYREQIERCSPLRACARCRTEAAKRASAAAVDRGAARAGASSR